MQLAAKRNAEGVCCFWWQSSFETDHSFITSHQLPTFRTGCVKYSYNENVFLFYSLSSIFFFPLSWTLGSLSTVVNVVQGSLLQGVSLFFAVHTTGMSEKGSARISLVRWWFTTDKVMAQSCSFPNYIKMKVLNLSALGGQAQSPSWSFCVVLRDSSRLCGIDWWCRRRIMFLGQTSLPLPKLSLFPTQFPGYPSDHTPQHTMHQIAIARCRVTKLICVS